VSPKTNWQALALPAMKNVAAIILAAGQSRRMGAFKPLLPFGKQTVIESCFNYLTEGGADSVVVVLGHRADDIRRKLGHLEISFAINPDPTSEMTVSIAAGVRVLPKSTRAILIAPVDYPAIPATVVSILIAEWSNGFRLVKPTTAGHGGHPVLVDATLRDELLDLDPTIGLRGLFDGYQTEVKRVEVTSPFIARDIDTWDDYRTLYSEIFGKAAPDPDKEPSNENTEGLI
jgi:molybdenum cofactor cytidylyltransferase